MRNWDETKITPEQERRYRNTARRLHIPGGPVYDYWHPVFQDECRKMNTEKELSTKGTKEHEHGGQDA